MSTTSPSNPLLSNLQTYASDLSTNLSTSVSNLTLRDYIRLVWIIGGYYFLRPYLEKLFRFMFEAKGGQQAANDHNNDNDKVAGKARISPNALRGGKTEEGEGESSEEEEEVDGKGADWGRSARKRQKRFLKRWEEEQKRRLEDEDDRDIADLLED